MGDWKPIGQVERQRETAK